MDRRTQQQLARAAARAAARADWRRPGSWIALMVLAAALAAWWFWQQPGGPPRGAVPPPGQGCLAQVVHGLPRVVDSPAARGGTLRPVCRAGYALVHASATRTALWVAERLEAAEVGGAEPRTNEFAPDPALPESERASPADYRRSGYDRGHLAPAADFSTSAEQMRESFYLSNIVPQVGEHNRGVWARLESHVRRLASTHGTVFVITGPVFDARPPRIGAGVAVPRALWKVVSDPARGRAVAWLIPNQAGIAEDDWDRYRVPVRQIEAEAGLDFNPELPAAQQDALETSRSAL